MVMARRRVDLRLEEELFARLAAEAERLGQTRTKFIERALEAALAPGLPPGDAMWGWSESEGVVAEPPSEPKPAAKPRAVSVPGVRSAREFVLDPRQAALNRSKKP